MAVQNDYTSGTITLTSGSANFTSTGAALQSAGIRAGDEILLPAKGMVLVIASITGENAGTLVQNCPAGAAGAAQPMRIRFQPDGSRYTAAARALVELLADGKLASLAGQTGAANKLPYLTGATTFGLTDLTAFARTLLDDGSQDAVLTTLGGTALGKALFAAANAAAAQLSLGVREVLTANRTYYVRTDGSDSNNGLANTAGGAFLTLQKAWNVVAALDMSLFSVTIQVADGTYTGGLNITAAPVGGSAITIQGNASTPGNCYMNLTGNFIAVNTPLTASVTVNGFKVKPAGSGYSGISVNAPAIVTAINIEAAGGSTGGFAGFYQVTAQGAKLYINPIGQSITGNLSAYVSAVAGVIQFFGGTITVTGTPAFSWVFAIATREAYVITGGAAFSGAATGKRYSVTEGSIINTGGGGASFFPGDVAGTTGTGGQYL
ncbi:hypothetical protein ABMA46_10255 [Mesorhizobium sp. CN5-321]|uniref:hypothetical protein n=1 Tax=Mesorhizobium hunchu TaxID=3157708 RepID=UPI0032B72EA7